MNYLKMFNNMHPGFFDDPGITGMPKDWVFSELIMDLHTHIENWYKKLGYETVLKWNSDGIVMEKLC